MLQNRSLLEHLTGTGSISLETRRSFLKATTLGLGCFGGIGTRSAFAKSTQTGINRPDTACIVFFLDGGPSHHDTFDPWRRAVVGTKEARLLIMKGRSETWSGFDILTV